MSFFPHKLHSFDFIDCLLSYSFYSKLLHITSKEVQKYMIVEHSYFHLIPSLYMAINVDVKICLPAADLVLAQFYFTYLLHYSTKKEYIIYVPVK